MILAIGEILFDEFPAGRRLGGAPYNFACHIKRLGLEVTLASRVGNDPPGREILARTTKVGLDPGSVQIDPHHPTGKVKVSLDRQGRARFTILPQMAYDHIALDDRLESLMAAGPSLVYFGTLAQRTASAHRRLQDLLSRRPARTRGFCDINLRPGQFTCAVVQACLAQSDILKVSDEELSVLAVMFALPGPQDRQIAALMQRFGIETIAVTCGSRGAALYQGLQRHWAPSRLPGPLGDTVGAGDAFSAVLATGLRLGWTAPRILERAVRLAGRVCTVGGAVPDDPVMYENIV